MTPTEIRQMSNERLLAETQRVAAAERQSTADLLALLIEVERRGVHLTLGYSSLFSYCTQALRLSEQAAYSRITAARAARRFPALFELLAQGALTLSSIGLLAPHVTDENHESLLTAARGKSTREVERLIAAVHPQPDIAASLRKVPVARQPAGADGGALLTAGADEMVATAASPTPPALQESSEPVARPRAVLAPLAPERYWLKVTISQETHDKLQRARALLRHAIPDGDPAAIIDRALTLLVERVARIKHGARRPRSQTRPRGRQPLRSSRHIPADVRRVVWTRDEGRCAFVGAAGRCFETAFLEFHHVVPFAVGGRTAPDNLELRCRAHNAHEARTFFG